MPEAGAGAEIFHFARPAGTQCRGERAGAIGAAAEEEVEALLGTSRGCLQKSVCEGFSALLA